MMLINLHEKFKNSPDSKSKLNEEIWQGLTINQKEGNGHSSSIALVRLEGQSSSQAHYHKITTEWYIILEGRPRIKIDDERAMLLSPGMVIGIPPNQVHRIWNEYHKDVVFWVISSPLWNPKDEYLVEP